MRVHHTRPATIEAAAVSHLPYILYPACILSHEAVAKSFICAVHRLGMPFEAGFPPTGSAVLRFHAHKQPARRPIKLPDPPDLHPPFPSMLFPAGQFPRRSPAPAPP